MTTIQEQEDLIERLSWHDDDVVVRRWDPLTEVWSPVKRYGAALVRSDYIERLLAIEMPFGSPYEVLMPFLSSDGIMFSVKN